MLKPFVRAAACAYDEARAFFGAKGVLTGNPVRGGFARAAGAGRTAEPATLLAFGGSQGSRVLNEALVAALPHLPPASQLRHRAPDRARDARRASRPRYRAAGREAEVVPFLDDMERRFAEADLVLSRSGATTCAELAVAGKAAILVPFAAAGRRPPAHERARAFAAAGAARMLEETDLTGATPGGRRRRRWSRTRRRSRRWRTAARRLGRPDAAARVADLLLGSDASRGGGPCLGSTSRCTSSASAARA